MTKVILVHGEKEATNAVEASKALIAGGVDMSNVPTYTWNPEKDVTLADLLVSTKLVTSKSEARRMCEQGAVSVKGTPTKDWALAITSSIFEDGQLLLKKGKKSFVNVVLQ